MNKTSLTNIIDDYLKQRRATESYASYEELYGTLSCTLHCIVGKLIKKESIDAELVQIIGECCFAMECLDMQYDPFLDVEKQQSRDYIQLNIAQTFIKQILTLYQDSSIKQTIQKGQPPRRLVHIPRELINEMFSLFN